MSKLLPIRPSGEADCLLCRQEKHMNFVDMKPEDVGRRLFFAGFVVAQLLATVALCEVHKILYEEIARIFTGGVPDVR